LLEKLDREWIKEMIKLMTPDGETEEEKKECQLKKAPNYPDCVKLLEICNKYESNLMF
jgi:hypothetical protein